MKQGKAKQLRDFIKSHEMRYFIERPDYSDQTHIKKAFKVGIDNNEYWVHFAYGNRPEIKDERILLKTMEEAKAEVQKRRDEHQQKKKKEADKQRAKLEDVTKFLNDFRWCHYEDWGTEEIKPDGQPIAEAIKKVYNKMPRREKDDELAYIRLLENYIEHGTIYTQALSFRKEHVVSVKYGEDGSVEVELTNGMTIIPKSDAVTSLIKVIFGDRLDTWSYTEVKEPATKRNKIEESKR